MNRNKEQCNYLGSKKTFQAPHWIFTRLATTSFPTYFIKICLDLVFLWGHDLMKNTFQVFVSIWYAETGIYHNCCL